MAKQGQDTSPTSVLQEEGSGTLLEVAFDGVEGSDDYQDGTTRRKVPGKSKKASGYTSKEPHEEDVLLGRGKPVSVCSHFVQSLSRMER